MRGPHRQVQLVLRRQGETHPGNITSALQQSSSRVIAARPHTGPELSDFQPGTIDEVRKLLASIPHQTSPLDVLPVSLLKDCEEVFAPAITTLANLSLQISAGAAATEEGGARQVDASQLQADI